MKYNKPEIAVLGSAVEVIESGSKGSQLQMDAPLNVTHSAYDSDE
jgi:hypothetical protein